LKCDIVLDDKAFETASTEMDALKTRTDALRTKLIELYNELTTALDTPAGKEVDFQAGNVLIKPIEDLTLVIRHISSTLATIIGTGYYKDVFINYEHLNESVKFN